MHSQMPWLLSFCSAVLRKVLALVESNSPPILYLNLLAEHVWRKIYNQSDWSHFKFILISSRSLVCLHNPTRILLSLYCSPRRLFTTSLLSGNLQIFFLHLHLCWFCVYATLLPSPLRKVMVRRGFFKFPLPHLPTRLLTLPSFHKSEPSTRVST